LQHLTRASYFLMQLRVRAGGNACKLSVARLVCPPVCAAAKPREKCGLAISDSMAQKNKMVGCWPCVHKIVEFAGWIAHEFR
jgi:hypothetical protein